MLKQLKKHIAIMLFILLTFNNIYAFASSENEEFYNKVANVFKNYKTVGGSFVVYSKGKQIFIYNYGYADKAKKINVETNTKFRIASISKMVTAIGLMQLVENKKISLDEDISSILGYKVHNPNYPDYPITLRMLLCHTSSLKDSPRFSYKRGTVQQMLGSDRVNDMAFANFRPGEKFQYSNFGFGLVGSIIEKLSNMPLEEYMNKNVFEPLNIDAAYYACNLKNQNISARYYEGDLAQSTKYYLNETAADTADPEHNYGIAVGKLWISADDLCSLLSVLCGNGHHKGKQILKPETIVEMRQEQKGQKYIKAETPYGLGIEHKKNIVKSVDFYGHQGLYFSSYNDAFFDPENQISMVLLTNGINVVRIDGTNAMARELFILTYKYLVEIDDDPFVVVD